MVALSPPMPEPDHEVAFDNRYPWLCASFNWLMTDEVCARNPHYLWGVLQGGKVAHPNLELS